MTPYRVSAALVVAIIGVISLFLVSQAAALTFVSLFFTGGDVLAGLGLVWVLVAPVPMAVAAVVGERTPWPWVAVVTLHLAVLLAVVLRLGDRLPGAALLGWGCFAAIALMSVAAATLDRPRPVPTR